MLKLVAAVLPYFSSPREFLTILIIFLIATIMVVPMYLEYEYNKKSDRYKYWKDQDNTK